MTKYDLIQRPRRNRKSESLRTLIRETSIQPSDFVLPLFVEEGRDSQTPISSMPGVFRHSIDRAAQQAKQAFELGIPAIALFPALEDSKKDTLASESVNPQGLNQRAIQEIKERCPEITVITDVAMDPYSSDGHDGVVESGKILNDKTLPVLAEMALSQARAGADVVAPSDMMDGRVSAIRTLLDEEGFEEVGILAYSAKYASAFYGPFRDALDSAPKSGDKKTYQMDPANSKEALREIELDIQEGADMVMVKPALAYLDIISQVKQASDVPVAAYNVSGEYAMVKAAAQLGWLNEADARNEMLLSIKRAGADVILSYFALDFSKDF